MNEKLSNKDYELINSYLDQELDRKDVVKFADRMAADPEISAEVADLMKVKAMVKELPTVTPPRNYILTRAMAEEARPKPLWERLFPVFRAAAAFCALALAFTFIFPFIQQSMRFGSGNQAAEESSVYDAAEEATVYELEEAPAFSLYDEQIVLEDRDYGGNADEYYNAVMPSFGVRGGNPRIEYMMRMEEESQNARAQEMALDPDNPPEGFISVASAEAAQRDLALKLILGGGLLVSIAGIVFLTRKKKTLEVS